MRFHGENVAREVIRKTIRIAKDKAQPQRGVLGLQEGALQFLPRCTNRYFFLPYSYITKSILRRQILKLPFKLKVDVKKLLISTP